MINQEVKSYWSSYKVYDTYPNIRDSIGKSLEDLRSLENWPLDQLFLVISTSDFVGRFSACYDGRPRGRFLDLRFGVTLTFKLIAGF